MIPTVLCINQESFSVASKQYRRAFRCCKPGQCQPDDDTSFVWFDFERDSLLIDYNLAVELWSSREDQLANRINPLLYTSVRWFPDDEVKRIRNLAWYMDRYRVPRDEYIWKLFTGLKKWYVITELMGSGNILEPRSIQSSEASLRKVAKYHLTPSYDLSFWDVRGEEHLEVKTCIESLDKAKMACRPMLGPRILPRYACISSVRFKMALRFCSDASSLQKNTSSLNNV